MDTPVPDATDLPPGATLALDPSSELTYGSCSPLSLCRFQMAAGALQLRCINTSE